MLLVGHVILSNIRSFPVCFFSDQIVPAYFAFSFVLEKNNAGQKYTDEKTQLSS